MSRSSEEKMKYNFEDATGLSSNARRNKKKKRKRGKKVKKLSDNYYSR